MHPIVELARRAVEAFVKKGERISPTLLPPGLAPKAAVFVSLKKHGELRGCIGTLSPTCEQLGEEVIQNAISSCAKDPRFPAVEEQELADLSFSVDVLEPAVPVGDLSELDPKIYGVIVSKGFRRGVLLPDLEGVDTVEKQLSIAMRKAGIGPDESGVAVSRFRVVRYT